MEVAQLNALCHDMDLRFASGLQMVLQATSATCPRIGAVWLQGSDDKGRKTQMALDQDTITNKTSHEGLSNIIQNIAVCFPSSCHLSAFLAHLEFRSACQRS